MHEWILDGIGTELIGLVIGSAIGGIAGYSIGIKSKAKQTQQAGNNAVQNQSYIVDAALSNSQKTMIDSRLIQTQKAGDNAKQVQNGGVINE